MKTSIFLAFILTFGAIQLIAAQVKSIAISRTEEKIEIDGQMNETSWLNAAIATDFLERNPTEGNPPKFKTEVRMTYDNNNLYVLGYCFDNHPDSILTQLGERDDNLNADLFTVLFDPYHQKLDAFVFSVSASGVQSDSRFSDASFNAVWESAVQIVDDGWIVEMRIPYYAIRFPKDKQQAWKINFERNIRRSRTGLQWSLVPKNIETPINYWGDLKGLSDIDDPLRLSLSPYVSSFTAFSKGESSIGYGAGADLKLGLNESFTLDMTLLPDFSQVRSDNIVKNLGAFEVVFEEQRPFFQEGIDLFNKSDLFYSRRIGGFPSGYSNAYNQLDSNEAVLENPRKTNLLNVAKISGRNKNGLGIGVMNAITGETNANIENTETGEKRTVTTEPLVNYNIISLDQNLKNNSSIYLINLNTTRQGNFIDANVTSLGGELVSKNAKYSASGNVKVSQRDHDLGSSILKSDASDGISYFASLNKISGNFKYGLSSENKSRTFNPNDLGVNFTTNIRTHALNLQYNKYNPFWRLNSAYNRFTYSIDQNYTTGEILKNEYNGSFFITTPQFHSFYLFTSAQIGDGIDLFESRVAGQNFIIPEFYYNGIGVSSDYRKQFALDGEIGYGKGYFTNYINNQYFEVNISPIIRVNDKLTVTPSSRWVNKIDDVGFAGYFDGVPKYGVRDVRTFTNILQGKYLFKNNLSLTLRIRHYWSYGLYDYYGDLDEAGYIVKDDSFDGNANFNFNAFNTDLIFAWQFAPGSFLNLVYKNSLQRDTPTIDPSYFSNVGTVLTEDQFNRITLKVVYFFDVVSSYQKVFE
ncbi:MAG: carbohydrate binding family 9 domain-containing protein [Flavobacteriales bacterium]|jgi:hypothetical protein|nr:carbohydrate binding family 9 domain-containing protein [Flavobacteriales bacterium]